MAITDPAAIKFSNEQFRPAADRLARCYYRSVELSEAWAALTGTNDEKFALLLPDIQRVATLMTNTFRFVWWADRLWQSGSMVALFPNDPAELVFDNEDGTAQDPNRPPLTGEDLRRVKNHMEAFGNWLSRGTDLDKQFETDGAATLPVTHTYFDDAARMANDGAKVPVTNWGRLVAVERCGDLVLEFGTTTPSRLTHILRAAVNPGEDV